MEWLPIYTNLPMDVIVTLPHPRRGHSQGQEMFLAPSGDKETCNYEIESSNHQTSLSTLRLKGLSHCKMKWWALYPNLPTYAIVRLPHPRCGDSHNHDTFLGPSDENRSYNYDIECRNNHPSLSTLSPNWLSRSKMKCWAIHTSLPVDVIIRLPHPPIGNSQGQETFLASSADKQTRNYDIECSNHHPSLSTRRLKRLSRSKMKWLAIYTNLIVDVIVRLPHPRSGDSHCWETL